MKSIFLLLMVAGTGWAQQTQFPVSGGGGGGGAAPGSCGVNEYVIQTTVGGVVCATITNNALPDAFDLSTKTSTRPVKTGTSTPATCGVGELFFDTDATAGQNLFGCTATNTWTLLGGAGGGGVSSVGLSLPAIFNVTGSPVTSSGTLTGDLATQTARHIFMGPDGGSPAAPTFRALVAADLPASITSDTSGNAATASALAANPTNCSAGQAAAGIAANGDAEGCFTPSGGSGPTCADFTASTTWTLNHSLGSDYFAEATDANGVILQAEIDKNNNQVVATFAVATAGRMCVGIGSSGGGSGDVAWQLSGSAIATRAAANFILGSGITIAGADDVPNTRVNYTFSLDEVYTNNLYARLNAANVFGASGTLDLNGASATTGLRIPVASIASPTASGQIAFETNTNTFKGGSNGVTQTLPYKAETVTLGTTNQITVVAGAGNTGATASIADNFDIGNNTSTKVWKRGTTPPATCTVGESFQDTDATPSAQLLACTATNTWTAQGGSSGVDLASPKTFFIKDEFIQGAPFTSNINYGTVNWLAAGMTITSAVDEGAWPYLGVLRLTMSQTANTIGSLAYGGHSDVNWVRGFAANANWEWVHTLRIAATHRTNIQFRLGLMDSKSTAPANNGIWIRYGNTTGCTANLSDTTWIAESRSGGTSTTQDTGVTVSDDNLYTLRFRSAVAGTILFDVSTNGGAYSSPVSISANVPTANLMPVMQTVACETAFAKQYRPDYFHMLITGLSR